VAPCAQKLGAWSLKPGSTKPASSGSCSAKIRKTSFFVNLNTPHLWFGAWRPWHRQAVPIVLGTQKFPQHLRTLSILLYLQDVTPKAIFPQTSTHLMPYNYILKHPNYSISNLAYFSLILFHLNSQVKDPSTRTPLHQSPNPLAPPSPGGLHLAARRCIIS